MNNSDPNKKKRNLNFTNDPDNRKPMLYYFIGVFIFMVLINSFLVPSIANREVIAVPYSEFITQVEGNDVSEVILEPNEITFVALDDSNNRQIYKTGVVNDPDLVSRLTEADVVFPG